MRSGQEWRPAHGSLAQPILRAVFKIEDSEQLAMAQIKFMGVGPIVTKYAATGRALPIGTNPFSMEVGTHQMASIQRRLLRLRQDIASEHEPLDALLARPGLHSVHTDEPLFE